MSSPVSKRGSAVRSRTAWSISNFTRSYPWFERRLRLKSPSGFDRLRLQGSSSVAALRAAVLLAGTPDGVPASSRRLLAVRTLNTAASAPLREAHRRCVSIVGSNAARTVSVRRSTSQTDPSPGPTGCPVRRYLPRPAGARATRLCRAPRGAAQTKDPTTKKHAYVEQGGGSYVWSYRGQTDRG